jgi:lysophospholipase L1-like esterase
MYWYEAEVGELVVRLAAHRIPEPAVFYGSSTIRLWTSLATDLGCERIVNAAFGGSTLDACAFFFERIIPPLVPASLIVYAGDNDLGDGRSPADVFASFQTLVHNLNARCGPIPMGFISIKPSPARAALLDEIRAANALVRTAIDAMPNGHYIDVFDAMLRAGKPRPELFLEDGLHLGPAGYAAWTELLQPFRAALFA